MGAHSIASCLSWSFIFSVWLCAAMAAWHGWTGYEPFVKHATIGYEPFVTYTDNTSRALCPTGYELFAPQKIGWSFIFSVWLCAAMAA